MTFFPHFPWKRNNTLWITRFPGKGWGKRRKRGGISVEGLSLLPQRSSLFIHIFFFYGFYFFKNNLFSFLENTIPSILTERKPPL